MRARRANSLAGFALDGAQAALVASVDVQSPTLQRMLYDAGVTREQLMAIAGEVASDAALGSSCGPSPRNCSGNCTRRPSQLKRRWRGADAAAPHPGELAASSAVVAALDAPDGIGVARGPTRRPSSGRLSGTLIIARMDFIGMLIDFVLHVDVHLATFVRPGAWVYALLFAIIFFETGVVVMPFLPGDSLLFVVGAMCAAG